MTAWISWYLIVTLLGWLTFPLIYRLFPALADRGYSLARAAGLLIWAYIFWLFTSLGLTENNTGGILFGLLPLAGLTVASFYVRLGIRSIRTIRRPPEPVVDRAAELFRWVRQNLRLLAAVEILVPAGLRLPGVHPRRQPQPRQCRETDGADVHQLHPAFSELSTA